MADAVYRQVARKIEDSIRRESRSGEQIPGELTLAELYAVSRGTVRKALEVLEKTNVVVRKPGRGTFVATQGVSHTLGSLTSFTDILLALDRKPGIIDISLKSVDEVPEEAEGFLPGAHFWYLERVRTADGERFCRMQSWLPDAIGALISIPEFESRQSLYSTLSDTAGAAPSEATEVIRAERASESDSIALGVAVGSPLLSAYRWTYGEYGQPIEYGRSASPGELYQYVVKLR